MGLSDAEAYDGAHAYAVGYNSTDPGVPLDPDGFAMFYAYARNQIGNRPTFQQAVVSFRSGIDP